MTTEFVDLPARSKRLFETEKAILAIASDALDEIGMDGIDDPTVPNQKQRYVSPGVPAWESPMLVVHPARFFVGQAGREQFQFPDYGDGVLGLRSVILAITLVIAGYPMSGASARHALPQDKIEGTAERLHSGIWGIFTGLIQAQASDQFDPGYRNILTGPAEPPGEPAGGFAGMVLNATIQL